MRKGKLKGQTKVVIPFFDTDGQRQYSIIKIDGTLYASKLYSGIRVFVKDNFGLDVDRDWLHSVPLICNEHDPEFVRTSEEEDAMIEQLIDSWELRDDEIEDLTNSRCTEEDVNEAEESVCSMPECCGSSDSGSLSCDGEYKGSLV